jgi:hypothetical protein
VIEVAIYLEKHDATTSVPEEYEDAPPLDRFRIRASANIASINRVLGALEVVLGFWETALGNAVGAAIFGSALRPHKIRS